MSGNVRQRNESLKQENDSDAVELVTERVSISNATLGLSQQQRHSSLPENIEVKINNVASDFQLPFDIDLRKLCSLSSNYSFGKSGKAKRRLLDPQCTAIITNNGYVSIMECKSEADSRRAADLVKLEVQQVMEITAEAADFCYTNVCGCVKFPFIINLQKVASKYPNESSYEERETCCFVNWLMTVPESTLEIYSTGSIRVTKAKSEGDVHTAIEKIYEIVREFQCEKIAHKPARKRQITNSNGSNMNASADSSNGPDTRKRRRKNVKPPLITSSNIKSPQMLTISKNPRRSRTISIITIEDSPVDTCSKMITRRSGNSVRFNGTNTGSNFRAVALDDSDVQIISTPQRNRTAANSRVIGLKVLDPVRSQSLNHTFSSITHAKLLAELSDCSLIETPRPLVNTIESNVYDPVSLTQISDGSAMEIETSRRSHSLNVTNFSTIGSKTFVELNDDSIIDLVTPPRRNVSLYVPASSITDSKHLAEVADDSLIATITPSQRSSVNETINKHLDDLSPDSSIATISSTNQSAFFPELQSSSYDSLAVTPKEIKRSSYHSNTNASKQVEKISVFPCDSTPKRRRRSECLNASSNINATLIIENFSDMSSFETSEMNQTDKLNFSIFNNTSLAPSDDLDASKEIIDG